MAFNCLSLVVFAVDIWLSPQDDQKPLTVSVRTAGELPGITLLPYLSWSISGVPNIHLVMDYLELQSHYPTETQQHRKGLVSQ